MAVYHTAPLPYGTEAVPADAPVQIIGGGEFVLGLFGKGQVPNAFMVVNRNYRQASTAALKVTLRGTQWQELDRTTGKWSKPVMLPANHRLTVSLEPGDGRLFRVLH